MHTNKKRLIAPEINPADPPMPYTPLMHARLQQVLRAMDRLYKGKTKRFTVYRLGPIQEK